MAHRPVRRGYNASQRALHWLTMLIVATQLIFGESVERVAEAERAGRVPDHFDLGMSNAHYWGGIAVLVLTLLRLVIRRRDGVPPPIAHGIEARLATATHHLFYVVLIAMPITGLAAWYVTPAAGAAHSLGKPLLLVLIALHVLGALRHHFLLKDETLTRMLRETR